jgi:hypothetical protein
MPTSADKSQVGRLLRQFKNTEAIDGFPWRAVFENYLADKSKWVAEEHRHSLKLFCDGGLNKYRTRAGTEGYSAKEVSGMNAARLFVEGKR